MLGDITSPRYHNTLGEYHDIPDALVDPKHSESEWCLH